MGTAQRREDQGRQFLLSAGFPREEEYRGGPDRPSRLRTRWVGKLHRRPFLWPRRGRVCAGLSAVGADVLAREGCTKLRAALGLRAEPRDPKAESIPTKNFLAAELLEQGVSLRGKEPCPGVGLRSSVSLGSLKS